MPKLPEPDAQAPDLDLPLIIGGRWSLAEQSPDTFTMIVFYRGLHCPMCKSYLQDLKSKFDDFVSKGFNVVMVSMDDEKKAKTAHQDWGLGDIPMAYDLGQDQAREWGLFISASIKDAEPDLFSEPGLFWIRPDGRLYLADVSNSPFSRPDLGVLLDKVDFIVEKNYPARGAEAA